MTTIGLDKFYIIDDREGKSVMNPKELYEKKVLKDTELPVQLFANCPKQKEGLFVNHWHEHIEIHYMLEGTGVFFLNQKRYEVKEGELFIINSNELHKGICERLPYLSQVVIFTMDSISEELAKRNIIFQTIIQKDDEIDRLMHLIHIEQSGVEFGYKQLCKSLVSQLVVYLSRNYAIDMLEERDSIKRRKNLERLNTVLCYMENHYPENISNKQLANLVYLSEDRFNHLFKENIGTSPLQYLNEIRLKKAKSLIQTQDCAIVEIAEAVGFENYNYFGRLFRRQYGCTPLEMKKGVI